ncbi:MAG: DUF4293 domain-containing protein [Agriterribacter sp.]
MLQRIQTVWLLLAGVFAFLTIRYPIYTGTKLTNDINEFTPLSAGSNLLLLIFTVALGLLPVITIFLYKNRSLQIKLTLAALGVYIICSVFYFNAIKNFTQGATSFWSVFYFMIPLLLLFAIRGIYRDQKLVKSIDRLR